MNGNSLFGQPGGRDRFTYQLALALAGRDGQPGDLEPMADSVTLSETSGKTFQRHLAEAMAGRDGLPGDLASW
ncbi:MAG: hypothetical protein AMXMBFR33_08490 [Candidatus Xenobia bacterium]